MEISLIIFFISLGLSCFFLLLTYLYYHHLQNLQKIEEIEKKDKSLDVLLEKYAVTEKKDVMKEKLAQISELVAETEKEIAQKTAKRTQIAEEAFKEKASEVEIVEQANVMFRTFSQGLQSALPSSEEERQKDLTDLRDTILALEGLDESEYIKEREKIDIGKGIFLDKMSQKIDSLIKELKLNENKLIPLQRLKYHSFKKISRIKNEDIEPIVNTMKETGFLEDFIIVNPELSLIIFQEKPLKFNASEKVLLAFAYSEEYLIPKKLMELTEWDKTFTDKVINSLKTKEILTIYDNNIKIDGFGSADERKEWDEFLQNFIKEEKEEHEKKRKRQEEREKEYKEKVTKKVEEFEKRASKKLEKREKLEGALPPPKTEPQRIKDMDNLLGAMDELGEIEKEELESKTKAPPPQEISEESISEKILEYYEENLVLTGGLIQSKKIFDYVKQQIPKSNVKMILDTLKKLQEMKMVFDSFLLAHSRIYLFQEMDLNEQDKEFLSHIVNKNPMTKEEILDGLKWDEEVLLKTMKKLQNCKVLRIEHEKIVVPGLVQKGKK